MHVQDPQRLEDLTGLTQLKEEAAKAADDFEDSWSQEPDESDEEFTTL